MVGILTLAGVALALFWQDRYNRAALARHDALSERLERIEEAMGVSDRVELGDLPPLD